MSVTAFKHALKLYEAMEKEADLENVGGVELHVYRGKITHLYGGLGISQSYYTQIFRNLTQLGCLVQLEKGSRLDGSVYVLHKPPDRDSWATASSRGLTKPTDYVILSQRVEALEKLLKGVDIGETVREVVELKERLQELEERVESNGKSKITTADKRRRN